MRLFNSDEVCSSSGETLLSAFENCEAMQEKQLFPGHLEIFVSSPKQLEQTLITLIHNNRISPSCHLLCVPEDACGFIKENDSGLSELIDSGGRSGYIIPKNISGVLNDLLENDRKALVPVISSEELSMAVVSPDSIEGILSEEEARGLCWLCGNVREIYIPVECENTVEDFYVRASSARLTAKEQNGRISITAEIKINGSAEKNDIPPEKMKKFIAKRVSSLCSRAIAKTVSGLHADLFGIQKSIDAKRLGGGKSWEEIIPMLDFYYSIKTAE